MGSKNQTNISEYYTDPNADYDEEQDDNLDDDTDDIKGLSKDFYSTVWEEPSASGKKLNTRRKIERRNELKELYSQFEDWDDLELGNDW